MLILLSSRQSGEYWVDPDGVGVGSPPVRVHCDMRGGQGLTRVGHSLQGEHSISKCPEPGCAVYNVLYDLPIKQVSTNLLYRVLVFWAHFDGFNGLKKFNFEVFSGQCLDCRMGFYEYGRTLIPPFLGHPVST